MRGGRAAMTAPRPRIALVMGDPSGIGPEVLAKTLALRAPLAACRAVVIADARIIARGAEAAGVTLPPRMELIDLKNCPPADAPLGRATARTGRAAGEALEFAVRMAQNGDVDGIVYAPLHKRALHEAGYGFDDELHLLAHWLGCEEFGEINVLDRLWTSRVTSHIGLARVADELSVERVLAAIRLIHRERRRAGTAMPLIAVAAFNPHAGEGGLFGPEEDAIIAPAVARARAEGIECDGPIAADTVFVRARQREFDAVVTMYHDQGQIAMKLLGFERGVTLAGGLPVPITTPAHGTAHDIVGRGTANPGAFQAALGLAVRMVSAAEA
jgi:4-hydroxythreonine-4-phosphate dehydrogenase